MEQEIEMKTIKQMKWENRLRKLRKEKREINDWRPKKKVVKWMTVLNSHAWNKDPLNWIEWNTSVTLFINNTSKRKIDDLINPSHNHKYVSLY